MPSSPSSSPKPQQITKRDLIKLKPPPTPVQLEGDPTRGLQPVTYHPIHGRLQQAPTISLKNQKVLDEDEYMQALSNIIKRDFFPCLDQFESERLRFLQDRRRQLKALQLSQIHTESQSTRTTPFASTSLDQIKWSETQPGGSQANRWEDGGPTPRLPQAATPGMTPLGITTFADTPSSTPDANHLLNPLQSAKQSSKSYDESLSLDEFCSRYTSEDNSSFSEILNNANRLKRLKYAWAYDSSGKHNARLLEATLKREHLIAMVGKMAAGGGGVGLVEGVSGRPGERRMVENVTTQEERLAIEAADQPKLLTQASSSENSQHESSLQPKPNPVTTIDLATAPALQPPKNPDSWPHVTRNALMFAPDADISSHRPAKPPPFPAAPPVILGGPKVINYASTRMTSDDLLEASMKKSRARSRHSTSTLSPTRSQIAAAINGTPYPQPDSKSPKVNGFSFVPEMATPNAEQLATSAEVDNLLTWGEIMATPLRVDGQDESCEELVDPGAFRIAKTPRREELAIGMARKASKSLRQKYGTASGLGTGSRLRHSLLGDSGGRVGASEDDSGMKTPRREEMLSPAAKLLLKKTGLKHGHSGAPSSKASTTTTTRPGIFTPKRDYEQIKLDQQAMDRIKRAKWDLGTPDPSHKHSHLKKQT